jgi:arsenate reductase
MRNSAWAIRKWTDEQLLDFIGQHPILMNRPIVVTPIGTKLCRPSEAVLDILPNPQTGRSPRKMAKS